MKNKKKDYYKFLWNGGNPISEHRYLAIKAWGPIPKGYVVNHKNGIKQDNRLENLEVVSRSADRKHAWDMGLMKQGEYVRRSQRQMWSCVCGNEWLARVKKPKRCSVCCRLEIKKMEGA